MKKNKNQWHTYQAMQTIGCAHCDHSLYFVLYWIGIRTKNRQMSISVPLFSSTYSSLHCFPTARRTNKTRFIDRTIKGTNINFLFIQTRLKPFTIERKQHEFQNGNSFRCNSIFSNVKIFNERISNANDTDGRNILPFICCFLLFHFHASQFSSV